MDKFIIMGGNRLNGKIALHAAKNAVLPLLSCCILCKDDVIFENCQAISDVRKMMEIIVKMGGTAEFYGNDLHINCARADSLAINAELTGSIRSSVFMLGSLIGRFKRAEVAYPGGCEIGKRPIDIHISGLQVLGVDVEETREYIECDGKNLHSGSVRLSMPSVGATENIIMAAALANGRTVIENAAREPEIEDLQRFLNAMGGRVSGAGTPKIVIDGVNELHGCRFAPTSDRIVGGTYLTMCASCGGDITVENCNPRELRSVLDTLKICGCRMEEKRNSVRLVSDGKPYAVPLLRTGPFPLFPTDMQPQFSALLSTAEGVSLVEENIFENRFKYVSQLELMGADIAVEGRRALITGVKDLVGGVITAEDLRGGAALVTAALRAEGITVIYGVEHIDRGYYALEDDLTRLGADIVRVNANR